MDIEVTKKGILVKWHQIAIALVTLIGTNIGLHFVPDPTAEKQRQEIEHRLVTVENQLTEAQEDLSACKSVEDFLIHHAGLDKTTPIPRDTTRRVRPE